ncbi:MAG: TIGR02710 family CRISPR-associated protein [Desulfosarcina sp.]|nr:TIGR02710 family CRISPR-associated protein [Desulfosarcina sp.]MBC2745185.1 TIGR02710 family CRISPR-associated protein [Desulfosarcina sp.]MBC2768093.1 TIGR02710 family CRISPR-associated protein [Desulfosarcina sp.]
MAENDPVVLICTVGGSPQPIITAIDTLQPIHTEFICTDKDPGTGQPGSCVCVTGGEMVCKSSPAIKAPDMPNIPTIAGLQEDRFDVTIVPSDDLDMAFWTIRNKLIEIGRKHPDAAIMADYTGGTKTMTAALVTAVLETENIALQLVTGNRPNLVKVKNNTQSVVSAGIDTLRYQKAVQPFLLSWDRFAYDEAAKGLSGISPPRDSRLRNQFFRLRDVSTAFAAWDRFDHRQALDLLDSYAPSAGPFLGPYLGTLRILTAEDQKQEPMQILDLWNNAHRRAIQGRFDDAMARCYRIIEWMAQWVLKKDHGVESGNLPPDFVPSEISIHPNSEGKLQAGLMKSWELIRLKHDGPAREFIQVQGNALLDRIKARNSSILAHGKTPIAKVAWQKMADWMEKEFIPVLLNEAGSVGIRKVPPQLPKDATPFQ